MNKIHNKVDLNLFKVMLTIAEEGSTVNAAQRLNVSQSAISHSLNRLREIINDPLFVKHGRTLVLTPHGRSILPTVKASLQGLVNCSQKSTRFDPQSAEIEFSIGLRDILEFLILPELLAPLSASGAALKFQSRRLTLDKLEANLLSGEMDIVVDVETPTSTKIQSEVITRESLCVVVGNQHPCYQSSRLTTEDFSSSQHALVSLNRESRAYLDSRIQVAGIKREVMMRCEHYLPAVRTVEQTHLILTMPSSYANYFANTAQIRIFPIPFKADPIPIRMYWRKDTAEEAYMTWIRAKLKSIVEKVMPIKG